MILFLSSSPLYFLHFLTVHTYSKNPIQLGTVLLLVKSIRSSNVLVLI